MFWHHKAKNLFSDKQFSSGQIPVRVVFWPIT